jgi:hypothetical protein
MAARAHITAIDAQTVQMTYTDEDGETRQRTFWRPLLGGYVRCVDREHPGMLGSQVCEGLSAAGSTLYCDEHTPLVTIIRREWRRRPSSR